MNTLQNWNHKTEWKTEADKINAYLQAYPNIGTITRKGKVVYYVTSPEYREASHPSQLI